MNETIDTRYFTARIIVHVSMLLFSPVMFFITLDFFALTMYLPTLHLCIMDYLTTRYEPHPILYFALSFLDGLYFIPVFFVIGPAIDLMINSAVLGLYSLSLVIFTCWLRFGEQHPLRLLFAIPNKKSRPSQSLLSRVLFGRKRSNDERQIIKEQVSTIIFKHSIFRKHPFEPSSLGIARGLVAFYVNIVFVVYAIDLYFSITTTSATVFTTQTTMVATGNRFEAFDAFNGESIITTEITAFSEGMAFFIATSSTTEDALSDLAISVDGLNASCSPQFSAFDGTNSARNCTSDSEGGIIEISTSSNSTISVWVMNTHNPTSGWEEVAAKLSLPYFLLPNSSVTGSTYPFKYITPSLTWISYVIANPQTAVSLSNTTSLKLDASFPTLMAQMYMPVEEFISPTISTTIFNVLSKAGGLFASGNGFFILIFGRSIWAVIVGGRPLSPFGIFGWIPSVKRNIHLHYPHLQSDCERGGMASFVEEVGMNVGIVTYRPAPVNVTTSNEQSDCEVEETESDNIETAELMPLGAVVPILQH